MCLFTDSCFSCKILFFLFFFGFDDSVAPVNYLGLFPLRIKLKTMT